MLELSLGEGLYLDNIVEKSDIYLQCQVGPLTYTVYTLYLRIQGADDKLGQLLD